MTVQKARPPYIYENYNVHAWYVTQVSTVPTIAKLQNALVAALNEYPHLPKYIFMVPDKDIVESIQLFDVGVKKTTFDNLLWLVKCIARCMLTRREDLKRKHLGAAARETTKIIWINMLARPIDDENPQLARIWKLRRKFNEVLSDIIEGESYMNVMTLANMEEIKYFDWQGNLTETGRNQF